MTKLIIQIPCYNEAETLGITLDALPRAVPGFDTVEWLIIDDGSTDDTVAVARARGVDHIVQLPHNRGLARAFMAGLNASLLHGADVIVNTDADNQYRAEDIPSLVAPVLNGEADIVVGARPIEEIGHFSPVKKVLQRIGSWVVRQASQTAVVDAPSGFRAMSREAAMRLNVFNRYTYTLETIIQAGNKNMAIVTVPVSVNEDLRPSRLVKSVPDYIRRSLITIVRISITYQPFRTFVWPGAIAAIAGFLIGLRFLYLFMQGMGEGQIQSLLLGSALLLIGSFLITLGMVAELIGVNRILLEDARWHVIDLECRLQELEGKREPSPRADASPLALRATEDERPPGG